MKLGIVHKDNKIINHRSLLKVLLNPVLRYYGYQIATKFENNILYGIRLNKCDRIKPIIWDFKYDTVEYDIIEKRRLLY